MIRETRSTVDLHLQELRMLLLCMSERPEDLSVCVDRVLDAREYVICTGAFPLEPQSIHLLARCNSR
jgi:hypothetical protein